MFNKLSVRPINLMIFADELMVSTTFLWGTVSFLVGISSISTLAEILGKWVCEVNMVMVTLGTCKSNKSIELKS